MNSTIMLYETVLHCKNDSLPLFGTARNRRKMRPPASNACRRLHTPSPRVAACPPPQSSVADCRAQYLAWNSVTRSEWGSGLRAVDHSPQELKGPIQQVCHYQPIDACNRHAQAAYAPDCRPGILPPLSAQDAPRIFPQRLNTRAARS